MVAGYRKDQSPGTFCGKNLMFTKAESGKVTWQSIAMFSNAVAYGRLHAVGSLHERSKSQCYSSKALSLHPLRGEYKKHDTYIYMIL